MDVLGVGGVDFFFKVTPEGGSAGIAGSRIEEPVGRGLRAGEAFEVVEEDWEVGNVVVGTMPRGWFAVGNDGDGDWSSSC